MIIFLEYAVLLMALFTPPVFCTAFLVIILASFGKSLGIREFYIKCLMSLFEWGAKINYNKRPLRNKFKVTIGCDSDSECDDDNNILDSANTTSLEDVLSEDENKSCNSWLSRKPSVASISGEISPKADSGVYPEGGLSRISSSNSLLRRHGSGASIIKRETTITFDDDYIDDIEEQIVNSRGWAAIKDSLDFMKAGIEAVIEDEVTSRFEAEHLVCWNMLTRTSRGFNFSFDWKLSILWILGFFIRYTILFPIRLVLFTIGLGILVIGTAITGLIPNSSFKRLVYEKCMLVAHRTLARSVTALIYFYNEEYRTKTGGICVANHTSPIDVLILGTDNCYALIGQKHGGFLGLLQRAFSRGSSHIWFDRSEAKDRALVSKTLKEHVADETKLPILIFPEGTCINNTSVMMFKKGSFEVGATIYPIAMKYDSLFGDAFWNSSTQSWVGYILRIMTSWAIICHVWYLPPMIRKENESAVDFASRVKKAIAQAGGLVDLEWDGQLKRMKVPEKMITKQRERYYNRLSRYTSCSNPTERQLSECYDSDRYEEN
uniref:PlsC domain-containing protein n=1 Tax=Parastrongyloides trichosuri TaxID=131310 RepID=A0A0N5A3A8_PARTI